MLTHVSLVVNYVRYIVKYNFTNKWLTLFVRVVNSIVFVMLYDISDLCINTYV